MSDDTLAILSALDEVLWTQFEAKEKQREAFIAQNLGLETHKKDPSSEELGPSSKNI